MEQNAYAIFLIIADLTGLSAGSKDEQFEVVGSLSPVVVTWAAVWKLQSAGPVFSDWGIPARTVGQITGAVFVVYGAHVKDVTNIGLLTIYGVNGMMLDNWGTLNRWKLPPDYLIRFYWDWGR
jgi:hypothetical protein